MKVFIFFNALVKKIKCKLDDLRSYVEGSKELTPQLNEIKELTFKSQVFCLLLYSGSHQDRNFVTKISLINELISKDDHKQWCIYYSNILHKGIYKTYVGGPPGGLAYASKEWREPPKNKKFLNFFSIKSTEKLPSLFVFYMPEKDIIIQIQLTLKSISVPAVYSGIHYAKNIIMNEKDLIESDFLAIENSDFLSEVKTKRIKCHYQDIYSWVVDKFMLIG